MPSYKAPVEDFLFLFHELLGIDKRTDVPGFGDLTPDMTAAILEGGAKFCEEVLQPLNQVGDEHGCVLENGVVRTPPGFKEAFEKFCAGGWNRLGAPEDRTAARGPALGRDFRHHRNGHVGKPGFRDVSGPDDGGLFGALGDGRALDARACGKKNDLRRMDGHDVPDGAALRHRPEADEDQGRGTGRRHLPHHRHQDLHFRVATTT